jgi:hypothetical protein
MLTRLRRLQGVWGLCVFVLVFKLMTGAICLADGPTSGVAADDSAAASATAGPTAGDEGGNCVLGEAAGCHCACAHAAPLTAAVAIDAMARMSGVEPTFLSSGYAPAPPGSLLRPPIA